MHSDTQSHALAVADIQWSAIVNKGELVDKMAETAGLSKSDAESALSTRSSRSLQRRGRKR